MLDNYEIVDQIGQGEHGKVYLVQDKLAPQKFYAMKKIPNKKNKFDVEAKLLLTLNHPNIIKIIQVLNDNEELTLILQLAEKGDLHNHIKKSFNNQVPEKQIINWLCQLSLGLYYLHNQNNIIHRDIKTRNVLVMDNGLLKLADFGIAKKLEKGQNFAKTNVGTPCYLSPELISDSKSNQKSDVWGLGCLLYETCTNEKPFFGQSIIQLINNIVNNDFKQISGDYSKWLKDLIMSMLQKNSQKRPNIQTILQKKELRKEFQNLKLTYKEYQNISYPQINLKTTKYYQREQKMLNKMFSESLKTAKNQKSIRLQMLNDNKTDKQIIQGSQRIKPSLSFYIPQQTCNKNQKQRDYKQKDIKKVQRQKFAGQSLKSFIANRSKKANSFKS